MMTFFCPSRKVFAGVGALGKEAGGFEHHVYTKLAPGEGGRVAFGQDRDSPAADLNRVAVDRDRLAQIAEDRVVLQQVRQGLRVGDVIDCHELELVIVE